MFLICYFFYIVMSSYQQDLTVETSEMYQFSFTKESILTNSCKGKFFNIETTYYNTLKNKNNELKGIFYQEVDFDSYEILTKLLLNFTGSNNNDVIVFSKDFLNFLGTNNILNIKLPKLIINLKEAQEIGVKANSLDIDDQYLWEQEFKLFIDQILRDKSTFIKKCNTICLLIYENNESGFIDNIESGNYILLYFYQNYSNLIIFFEELSEKLSTNDIHTEKSFYNFIFSFVNVQDDQFFPLVPRLLTDIKNIVNLIDDLQYKFTITDFIKYNEYIIGRPILVIKIIFFHIFIDENTKFYLMDQVGRKLDCKKIFIIKEKKLFLLLRKTRMKILKITKLTLVIENDQKIELMKHVYTFEDKK